jgi:hypothetical protein
VQPATALAVASLTLGATAVALGVTLIWFFLALPFGLVAIGCAVVERRRTKRETGRAAGGIVTAGLVLGLAAVPLSLGGLVVIPRAQDFVGESVRDANGVVAADLETMERSIRGDVDALDRTLTENVNESTGSLSQDFDQLESSSAAELERLESELKQVIAQLEQATRTDLSELESSLQGDISTERQILAGVESDVRAELEALRTEVAELRARVDELRR